MRQRARGGPADDGLRRRRRRLLPDVGATQTEGSRGFQEGKESGENIGNNNRRVRSVLASVFRVGYSSSDLRLRGEPGVDVAVTVAGVLQLGAEPCHLYGVQPGVPARVPAAAVRAPRAPPPRASVALPAPSPSPYPTDLA